MYMVAGNPVQERLLEKVKLFLHHCGLRHEGDRCYTAVLLEEDEVVATGSLNGNVIKYVAVSPAFQGEDLTARIMTELLRYGAEKGESGLMLYTKPVNQHLFAPFGFRPVVRTRDVLIMENGREGLAHFLDRLRKPGVSRGPVGCIVAHADPFTLGHRYLTERAAAECEWVHLFIVAEDRGMFSPEERLAMAKAACRDLPNVIVQSAGPYMVSAATFPTYFLKEGARADDVRCEADVRLFGEKIAPALGVTRRYVGTEPLCPVTARYNAMMKALLPSFGVTLCEIERVCAGDAPVSASRVRALLTRGEGAEALLPAATARFLQDR